MRNHTSRLALFLSIALSIALAPRPGAAQVTLQQKQPTVDASHLKDLKLTNLLNVPATPPFDLKTFADDIEKGLKGRCAGYQFVVSWGTTPMQKRAGGDARRAPDASPRKMTVNERYNLASVSKTFTAAAAMKLLTLKEPVNTRQSVLDKPAVGFMPASFKPAKLGKNVGGVTLRELLTHTSGIRCDTEVTLDNLRACLGKDIALADKVYQYNNNNFALFRVIIPFVQGVMPAPPGNTQPEAHLYGIDYMRYVNAHVFVPAGLPMFECKPAANAGQCYQYPGPVGAGTDFGDMTETNASRGWTLSSLELAQAFSHLLYSDKILPKDVVARMERERLGLYPDVLTKDVTAYSHGGYYPGKKDDGTPYNPGELNSLVFGMTDGISVTAIVNSQIYDATTKQNVSLYNVVRDAAVKALK